MPRFQRGGSAGTSGKASSLPLDSEAEQRSGWMEFRHRERFRQFWVSIENIDSGLEVRALMTCQRKVFSVIGLRTPLCRAHAVAILAQGHLGSQFDWSEAKEFVRFVFVSFAFAPFVCCSSFQRLLFCSCVLLVACSRGLGSKFLLQIQYPTQTPVTVAVPDAENGAEGDYGAAARWSLAVLLQPKKRDGAEMSEVVVPCTRTMTDLVTMNVEPDPDATGSASKKGRESTSPKKRRRAPHKKRSEKLWRRLR